MKILLLVVTFTLIGPNAFANSYCKTLVLSHQSIIISNLSAMASASTDLLQGKDANDVSETLYKKAIEAKARYDEINALIGDACDDS